MTKKQIKAEIAALRAITPKLPRFNLFNENIHAKVAAQIEVLENDLGEHEIYDRSVDSDDCATSGLWPEHIRECALDAQMWRDGDKAISPSESWAPLAHPKLAKHGINPRK